MAVRNMLRWLYTQTCADGKPFMMGGQYIGSPVASVWTFKVRYLSVVILVMGNITMHRSDGQVLPLFQL